MLSFFLVQVKHSAVGLGSAYNISCGWFERATLNTTLRKCFIPNILFAADESSDVRQKILSVMV